MAPPPSPDDHSPLVPLISPVLQRVYGVLGTVCLLGLGLALIVIRRRDPGLAGLMVVGYGTLGLLCALGWRGPARRARVLLGPVMLVGLAALVLVGLSSGWGLATPGLALISLAVLVAHLAGAPGLGWITTAGALAVVAGLGLAETQAWFGMTAVTGAPPLGSRLVIQAAAILAGSGVGQAITRLLRQHIGIVQAREQRFLALLGMATSAYLEADASGRLTQLSRRDAQGRFVPLPEVVGRPIWDAGQLQFDAAALASLRNSLAQPKALAALPVRWLHADGSLRHGLLNCEPEFDRQGRLAGFWGVACDISAEQQARGALASTEARYQDLFNRLPTALLLHCQGRIVEANTAAARLLGYACPAQMIDQPLLDRHFPGAGLPLSRQRLALAEALAVGDVLPATDLTLYRVDGQAVAVRALALRTDHAGQPAVLSIFIDERGPRAAAQALARSQALLSQVVTLAPDIITLTDLDSGRYVMVNDSFCRLLGHPRAAAEGQTSLALGVWQNLADRANLIDAIHRDGRVQDQLITFNTRAGQALPLLMSGVRFDSDGQSYLLLNGRDLTEANRVQQEREAILAHASVGIAFTRERRFVLANAQFETMYGWPAGQLAGQPLQALWNDPALSQALEREIGPALARGESIDIEREGRRRDGSPFRVRLRARAIDPARPATSGTIWITEDVTNAHQAEQQLARALDAAEAANRAKSAFLANTSHEIRTPLNGVLGLARLAGQPGLPAARRQAYLDQITESAQALSGILSDILDVAKIESGKLQLEAAAFDLPALLTSLTRVYSALASSQGLGFALDADPGLPQWVLGDAVRVRQILANFLQNALKFCATGSVRLVARAGAPGWVRFEVQDTGPGIPPEIQARLFERFTQADESTTRRFGGTGLGLSICRELAGLMGGEVGLRSQAGAGSCFHALLPLPASAAAEPAPASGAPSDRLQGARVLLVEDNPVNMMIGVALLELWGVQVSQASDGPAALRAVDEAVAAGQPLDAVLMDLQMPGMSGHEATLVLRRQHAKGRLPVIALTAAALVSERERALAHGMTDFLTKPINPQRLHEALLRALPDRAAPEPEPG